LQISKFRNIIIIIKTRWCLVMEYSTINESGIKGGITDGRRKEKGK